MLKEELRKRVNKAQRKYRASTYGRTMIRIYLNSPKAKMSKRRTQVRHQQKKKFIILSHYGKGGKAKCCWRGCTVSDLDMLSLDHINNDGFRDPRRAGAKRYRILIKENFPVGFQTLCMNHQWKKHMLNIRKDIIWK